MRWKILFAVLLLLAIVVPVVVFAQEVPAAEVAANRENLLDVIPGGGLGQIGALVITLVFGWLAKQAVGKKWLQVMLEGLEVGVNNAWEEYVKEKKLDGKKLKEDEKQKARELALDRARSVMGIGAKILLATTPQAKVMALISGIVNRRKREAK